MPRAARIVIPGCPHHVTQRGNNRQDVFFTDEDRSYYLDLLCGNWRDSITQRQEEQAVACLRLKSNRGRPLGSDQFIAKLEAKLHGRLRPGKRGRPRTNE